MKKLWLILFALILLVHTSLAAGPHTHNEIGRELFAEQKSDFIKQCLPYQESFLAGSVAPDITVVYYYTNRGEAYRVAHNWNIVNELMKEARTQDELCFVYGYAEHLIIDSIFHNYFIPELIESTGIPNVFIHPLGEKKYDTIQVQNHPELLETTPRMLDIMFTPKGDRYIEMLEKALGENAQINVRNEFINLASALGTFYESAYKPRSENIIFRAYPYVDKFTNFLAPVLAMSSAGKADSYFRKSKEEVTNVFNNWGTRYQLSPHGFEALGEANQKASYWNWAFLFLAISPFGLVYWRKNWWYTALIPAIVFVTLLVMYSII